MSMATPFASFAAAMCIGCGACVAACKNSSAMLFVGAKVSHLALLPQGDPERSSRVLNMIAQMDKEGFGSCTNTGACEATCAVYQLVFENLKEGMTQKAVSNLVGIGYGKMQLRGEAMVLFGPSAALPHGSKQPRALKQGDVVLMDDGCSVEGYSSDVTRTAVFGKPSEKLQRAFEAVRKAQDADLAGPSA